VGLAGDLSTFELGGPMPEDEALQIFVRLLERKVIELAEASSPPTTRR